MTAVVVVGSLNHDTTAFVDRLPVPGETVMASRHITDTGGKGANQAVAAARLGAEVSMVGRVGDDVPGQALLSVLDDEEIDRSAVVVDTRRPTGAAFISVGSDGENMIIVSPGANAHVVPDDLPGGPLGSAGVVLAQLEIPLDTVARAAELSSGTFILNPAPATQIPAELMAQVDILVPNRTEAELLSGAPASAGAEEQARAAARIGARAVVVTLGADGAYVWMEGVGHHLPAPEVEAVDPTAAGDAFCGALAAGLSQGLELIEAAEWAVLAGAVTVTRAGAQSALPTRQDLEALLG